MKKKIIFIVSFSIVIIIGLILTIVLINNANKKIDLTNTLESETFKYDGLSHSLKVCGDIPDSVNVTYSNNEQTEVGSYIVEAYLTDTANKYNDLRLSATLTIEKGDLNVSLSDALYTFDGTYKNLNVSGDIPLGVTVTYSMTDLYNVGVYNITATLNDTNNHYNDLTLNAKLTIVPKEINLSYLSEEFTYDGNEKSHLINGDIPETVTVSYENETNVNAGTYTALVTFGGQYLNYGLPETISSTYTINKAYLTDIVFDDKTYTYDKTVKTIKVENSESLGDNFTITYNTAGFVNAGIYEISVLITDSNNNYNDFSSTKTLTINKAPMTDVVTLNDQSFIYDGKPHSLLVNGLTNDEIVVTYQNNNQTEVNVYTVFASFSSQNYEVIDDLSATLIIQKDMSKELSFSNKTIAYDANSHTFELDGNVPSDLNVRYTNNVLKEVGTYEVVATLSSDNPEYSYPDTLTATITIEYPFLYSTQAKTYLIDSLKNYKNIYIPQTISVDNELYYLNGFNNNVFKNTEIESVKFDSLIQNVSLSNVSFENDVKLISVTLPKDIVTINSQMFKGCTGLTSIIIPDSVTSISTSAFEGCTSLSNITFPQGTYTIGSYAFKNCINIKNLILSGNITKISSESFENCNLYSISGENTTGEYIIKNNHVIDKTDQIILGSISSTPLTDKVYTIGSRAFANVDIKSYDFENINIVGNYAFQNSGLEELIISSTSSLASIEKNAFENSNLKSIKINNSLTRIKENTFANCKYLDYIELGSSINTIDNNAFLNINPSNFIVSSENETYASLDANGLFEKSSSNLILGFNSTDTSKANAIYSYAFSDNTYIKELYINSISLKEVAIYNNPNLTTIHFGERLIDSDKYPIVLNTNLISIDVSSNNIYFRSDISNALVGINDKILYVGTTSGYIPENTEVIGDNAFSGYSIDTIDITSQTNQFCESCFQLATINTLYLDAKADNILVEKNAFANCTINKIIYSGSEEDFINVILILGIDTTNCEVLYK